MFALIRIHFRQKRIPMRVGNSDLIRVRYRE